MTDIWDFSDLIDSWREKDHEVSEPRDEETEIIEQMQKEIGEIDMVIQKLQNNELDDIENYKLLATPKTPVYTSPAVSSLSEQSQENQQQNQENQPTEKSMSKSSSKQALVKSPRIVKPKAAPSGKTITRNLEKTSGKNMQTQKQAPAEPLKPVFCAIPSKMEVVNFQISQTYITEFKLQNVDFKTHGFQVKFPKDPVFTVTFEGGNITSSRTISGLGINFTVTFKPTEQKDYDEDEIVFQPDNGAPPTIVKLNCYRDPPRLKHPDIVDLGATLVHSLKPGKFIIKNEGGVAFFAFRSPIGRDDNMMYINGSFTLIPSQFQLQHGESKEIEVKFKPTEPGDHTATFDIVAEHFPQKFEFLAKGVAATPSLKFAISPDERLFLPFLPQDVNTTRSIEIINQADVQYPYHVQILKPREGAKNDLVTLYPDTDTATVKNASPPFIVTPVSGIIGAHDKITLNVTFAPKMFAFYKANIVILADRIPDETGKQCSRKMLTIAVEATTGPSTVSIQPPLVLFNSVVPYTKTIRSIDVVNDSHLDIHLQWKKSNTIQPTPIVFNVAPNDRITVDLACFLTKRIGGPLFDSRYMKTMGMLCSSFDNSQPTNEARPPTTQHYSINMSALEVQQQNDEAASPTTNQSESASPAQPGTLTNTPQNEENNNKEEGENKEELPDEMPNIFGLRHWSSSIDKREYTSSVTNLQMQLEMAENQGRTKDEVGAVPDDATQMTFTYYAHTIPPNLIMQPPIIEFGSVLTGKTATEVLKLVNDKTCPIKYWISYPHDQAWSVSPAEGIVEAESTVEVDIALTFEKQTALEDIITLKTAWADELGNVIESLPPAVFAIPVFAMFDCPIISVDKRIIDFGDVYPTLEYSDKINIALLNSFPTEFCITYPDGQNLEETHENKVQIEEEEEENASQNENQEEEEKRTVKTIKKYVIASPNEGYLNMGDSKEIGLSAVFAELGRQALVLQTQITGKSYTIGLVANVVEPKITLLTKSIDFSSDFVICKESHSLIKIENECDVPSTIRVEMIDNCNNVFKLGDDQVKSIKKHSQVEIPVSCYSEIHGDYNGKVELIIEDHWQHKEIMIPLHVKALGSFFAFEKHTLGYIQDKDGDFISFGNKIACSQKPLIRRLSLVNYSSAPIEVEWSLANYVKGRNYANVDLSVNDEGGVDLSITTTPEADIQSPFKLETQKSVVESHGKIVVEIEFDPSQRGEFSGCVAARSGEFIHMRGLHAIVI